MNAAEEGLQLEQSNFGSGFWGKEEINNSSY